MAIKDFKGFKTADDTYNCCDTPARESIATVLESAVAPTGGIAVDEQFYLNGKLYIATTAISQGSAIVVYPTSGYNCKLSDSVTGQIKAIKDNLGTASTKDSTNTVTDSTNLVESGAVLDTLRDAEVIKGKNKFNYEAWKNGVKINKGTGVFENNGVTLTATDNDCYTKYTIPNTYPVDAIIPVTEGKKISLVWDCAETTFLGYVYIFPNGAPGSVNDRNTAKKLDYTPTSGVTFVTVRFGVNTSGNTIHYSNIMVVDASETDLSYEPYSIPLKDVVPQKCDNSVIGTVEDGATASQAYAVGAHFIRDGKFCTCIQAIAVNDPFTLNTNYVEGDIASTLKYLYQGVMEVSVTADGVKSYQTLLNELQTAFKNYVNAHENEFYNVRAFVLDSQIFIPTGISATKLYNKTSNPVEMLAFSRFEIGSNSVFIDYCLLSGTLANNKYKTSVNNTITAKESDVPASQIVLKVISDFYK